VKGRDERKKQRKKRKQGMAMVSSIWKEFADFILTNYPKWLMQRHRVTIFSNFLFVFFCFPFVSWLNGFCLAPSVGFFLFKASFFVYLLALFLFSLFFAFFFFGKLDLCFKV